MTDITRRRFAGLAGATVAAGLAPSWTPANAASERDFRALGHLGRLPKPNLLVILADDLGWADLSAYGAPEIRTPNLDALAASGVRFTNGYSASSVCSPTRFGLYTGRSLASLLKGQGYDTALIGKWTTSTSPRRTGRGKGRATRPSATR